MMHQPADLMLQSHDGRVADGPGLHCSGVAAKGIGVENDIRVLQQPKPIALLHKASSVEQYLLYTDHNWTNIVQQCATEHHNSMNDIAEASFQALHEALRDLGTATILHATIHDIPKQMHGCGLSDVQC